MGNKAEAVTEDKKLKVIDLNAKEVGEVTVPAKLAGSASVVKSLVHDVVTHQLSKRRAGTQSALTVSDMKGGGRKPWKQKGTGRARAGTNTSTIWVGGAVAHAPKPRDYTNRLSKRARQQSLLYVLSDKFKSGNIVVINEFKVEKVKTKEVVSIIEKLGLLGRKVGIVLNRGSEFALAARNIADVRLIDENGLNVYDVLNADVLLLSKETVEGLGRRLIGNGQ